MPLVPHVGVARKLDDQVVGFLDRGRSQDHETTANEEDQRAQAAGTAANVMDAAGWLWYKPDTGEERGLAAPVAQLLQRFNEHGTRGEI